jgi:hypothetical protein
MIMKTVSIVIITVGFILLSICNLFGQAEVTGRVLGLDDQPIPGVNVLIKGTPEGVVANKGGYFTIILPYGKSTLVFDFIGYKRWEQYIETDKKNVYEVNVNLIKDKIINKKQKSSGEVTSRPFQAEIQ